MAVLRATLLALLCGTLGSTLFVRGTSGAEAPTEYQVKAVFLFNFSHFVEWPAATFTAPNQPFAICVLGDDPFGTRLDEAVRGEQIDQHPLSVRGFIMSARPATARFCTSTAPKRPSCAQSSPRWTIAARSPYPIWTDPPSAAS